MKKFSKFLFTLASASLLFTGVTFAADTTTSAADNTTPAADTTTSNSTSVLSQLSQKLELTDAQKNKINELLIANEKKAHDINEKLLKQRREFFKAVHNEHYDLNKIKSIADKQGHTISNALVESANLQHKIALILTPKQRQQLRDMMPKFLMDESSDNSSDKGSSTSSADNTSTQDTATPSTTSNAQ